MKSILSIWDGEFEVDGKKSTDIDDVLDKKDGDDFHIVLIPGGTDDGKEAFQ